MNPIINEKLNTMFAEKAFYENHDFSSLDALYTEVVVEVPDLTKDELAAYLTAIGQALEKNTDGELSVDDLDEVAGGIGIMTLIVAGGVIYAAAWAGSKVGPAIGEAIYWMTKKN